MSNEGEELIGRTLGGQFTLTRFIGEGAMAAVFRGSQDAEPRDVAVKVMHPRLASDEMLVKRFQREAKAAARFRHPNSVQILGYGVDGAMVYLVMELLAGEDLFEVLARERRFPEARAVRVLMQTCDALGAAHAQQIVHRDLKPENLMMLRDPADPAVDHVKVLDFGIAKIMHGEKTDDAPASSAPSSVLTHVGAIVGTPEYMAPEQCRGEPVDARTDVYACGALLYRLVAGRPPFVGPTPISVILQQADDVPLPPSTFVPGLDPRLERTILKALAKAPELRHQTALELKEELGAVLSELEALSRRRDADTDPPEKPLSSRKSDAARSSTKAHLPGVPDAVAINAGPAAEADTEDPPATKRSRVKSTRAAPREAAPAAPEKRTPEVEEPAKPPPDVQPVKPKPEVEERAAPSAARLPAVPKASPPAPVAPAAHGFLHDPPVWAIYLMIAIVCFGVWLVRYLRFR